MEKIDSIEEIKTNNVSKLEIDEKERTLNVNIMTKILNMFPYHYVEKISLTSKCIQITKYAARRKPFIDQKIFIKAYTFPQERIKEEAYSLVSVASSGRFAFATGHYGKVKLYTEDRAISTIILTPTVKYDLLYTEKTKHLLCISNTKNLEIIDVVTARHIRTIEHPFVISHSQIIRDKSRYYSAMQGPFLSFIECLADSNDYTNNRYSIHQPIVNINEEKAYMTQLLYCRNSRYLITLNSESKLFLFYYSSTHSKWALIKFQDNNKKSGLEIPSVKRTSLPVNRKELIDLENIINKTNNSSSNNNNISNSNYNNRKSFATSIVHNENSIEDKVLSLVELNNDYLGEEMYDKTLKIISLPELEFIRLVKLPYGNKIINLSPNIGEDILFNIDSNKHCCNFIFPFNEVKYKKPTSVSVVIPSNMMKERYIRVSSGKNSIILYTMSSVYYINLFK